jgi:CheY-like chemotaxis protein
MLVELLSGVGFEVRAVENGREAIAAWQSWQPHLIWMDIRMPIMDGYEATKRIKSLPGGEKPIIIALTAHAFEDMQSDAMQSGCDDFVRKPFRETEIYDKLSYHLGVKYTIQNTSNGNGDNGDRLIPADLENMSPEWVERLHNAATKGQSQQSLKIIEEIYPTHPITANALTKLVHEFRFGKLVALCGSKELSSKD